MRIALARACRLAAPLAAALLVPALWAAPVEAETRVEKPHLKLGFIKLSDMAPLAIAYEKGFFADEGLFVTLEPQADWKVLLDRVIDGELDGAQMLGGQPLAATIGLGTQAHVVTPLSMDLNGNGITVSNEVWGMMKPGLPRGPDGRPEHPIKADYLKPVIDKFRVEGRPFKMGMVSPVSSHNFELRYWLAAGGIHPGFYGPNDISGQVAADVLLLVIPPPQMPAAPGGRNHKRLLRGRAVEPAGGVREHRRAGHHRLRDDLEK
jgi:nitrate/nitrite transport system substrate-binding protein